MKARKGCQQRRRVKLKFRPLRLRPQRDGPPILRELAGTQLELEDAEPAASLARAGV